MTRGFSPIRNRIFSTWSRHRTRTAAVWCAADSTNKRRLATDCSGDPGIFAAIIARPDTCTLVPYVAYAGGSEFVRAGLIGATAVEAAHDTERDPVPWTLRQAG